MPTLDRLVRYRNRELLIWRVKFIPNRDHESWRKGVALSAKQQSIVLVLLNILHRRHPVDGSDNAADEGLVSKKFWIGYKDAVLWICDLLSRFRSLKVDGSSLMWCVVILETAVLDLGGQVNHRYCPTIITTVSNKLWIAQLKGYLLLKHAFFEFNKIRNLHDCPELGVFGGSI
jgi:hypothetical protein